MSGGGSSKTSTQSNTSSSEPWKPAQASLKYSLGEANNLYKSGVGAQPYTGSTVVPFSEQTTGAMDTMTQKADAAQGAMAQPITAFSEQMEHLNPIARGDFSDDTTFMNTLGRAQEDAGNAVNMGAASAGRYGSAVHQGNVAREVGDLTNRSTLDRQKWAQDGIQSIGSQMGAAYDTMMKPEQTQMGVGSMYEDLMGRQMQDEIRVYEDAQNAPWDNLARYNAIVGGAGALGGSSSASSSVSQPKNYGSAFGNALTGYASGGVGGAALGGLSGLF